MQITKNSSLMNDQPQKNNPLNDIKKDELVRLMLQSLNDLGLKNAATVLESESGVSLESNTVMKFRSSILSGAWETAESLLLQLPFLSSDNHLKVQFLIRQQKFLELLEQSHMMQALHVLRNEITPLGQNTDRLHLLTSLVLCSSIEDIKQQASWDGVDGNSREVLLNDIQHYIDPTAMIPNHRLVDLIHQAISWQKRSCLYHNQRQDTELSLFSDHMCDKNLFPTTTTALLLGHKDEIWHVAYSHDGRYLASVSKDNTCIIWSMKTLEKVQVFESEASGSYCAWSPDDTKLLVCSTDLSLRLWDPFSGILLQTFQIHKDQVTSCVWLPDSLHFISGACDMTLCLWNCLEPNPQPIHRWSVQRITDMKITKDGKRLVTVSYEKHITVYDINGLNLIEMAKMSETQLITSLTLTKDGRFGLVNIQGIQELHLWDLDQKQIVHKYTGQKQNTYIIRSTLGGLDESFILSGSEDNRVYIWSREHETLLEELEGHENTVNCVSWCPVEPMQFVSASDDHSIRVWGSHSV